MEKAEISRLINSFNAIKGYFDTTKRYMPQIAKLVFFIEEIVPLLNTIHENLHQSSSLIPGATAKLDKVTSATEMAATEVMDIVDNVINRLNNMSESLDTLDENVEKGFDKAVFSEKTKVLREEIDGSQDDLFSIMNALQFQDITTQQINSIASTIENVYVKLSELLKGFEDDAFDFKNIKNVSFDPNAEFDFDRSAESQKMADEFMKNGAASISAEDLAEETVEEAPAETAPAVEPAPEPEPEPEPEVQAEASDASDDIGDIVLGEDGQPDIQSIMNQLNANKKNDN